MLKVIAKNEDIYVVAVDYCLYLVNKKHSTIYPFEYLLPTLKFGKAVDYGDFTIDFPSSELEKAKKYGLSHNRKYIEELMEVAQFSKKDAEDYIKKKYEQILADFNSVMKKEIYPDVKLDPQWVDDYQGLYLDV